MRKLVFVINLSVDGCCDHSKLSGDDDTLNYHAQLTQDVDTLLYGRKTYQLMVPFWPDVAKNNSGPTPAMNNFAKAFAGVKNIVVFSRSLDKVEDQNTRIVRANLKDEILKLKQAPGKNIVVGGVDIPTQLIQLGLVDEYHFVIQPIFVGEGRRLMEGVSLQQNLKLVETRPYGSGVGLRYVKG